MLGVNGGQEPPVFSGESAVFVTLTTGGEVALLPVDVDDKNKPFGCTESFGDCDDSSLALLAKLLPAQNDD